MKIKFYIDYDEDLMYVLARLSRLDPAGLENRLKAKEIPVDMVKAILAASGEPDKKSILDKFLHSYYLENQNNFEKVKGQYQKIWLDKTDIFFSNATEIMGDRKWNYDEYRFLVSSFFSRAQWGRGNKLAVFWKREPQKFWFLNAYELVLSHVFETVDQLFKTRPVSDWHIWALAEAIAYILVYRDERLKDKLWPMLNEPTSFSYPQLIKHINYLDALFKKTANFDKFIRESVNYIEKFTVVELTTP